MSDNFMRSLALIYVDIPPGEAGALYSSDMKADPVTTPKFTSEGRFEAPSCLINVQARS